MKYSRELKIGLVLIVAVFLLYFGMNFLKGLDIFSPTRTYYGQFERLNELTTSAPVYIKGYKVGQVSRIDYDFAQANAFNVAVVINKDIRLPRGTSMTLIADGLMGGGAVELRFPQSNESQQFYAANDTLPTGVESGLIEQLQSGVIADLSNALKDIDSLVNQVQQQVEGNHIQNILANADNAVQDLNSSSGKLKQIINNDVPPIINNAKTVIADAKSTMANVNSISQHIDSIDINGMAVRIDTTLTNIQQISQSINSTDGTLGLLLNDQMLYKKINSTVESADTLISDIKKNPKRYINISIFGKKDK